MHSKNSANPFNTHGKLLYEELAYALKETDGALLKNWGVQSSKRFVKLGGQRINSLSTLATSLGKASVYEFRGMVEAWRHGRTGSHVGDRSAIAIDNSISFVKGGINVIGGISNALILDPKANAPKVIAAFLGFYAGSGGVDGDGGIPDLDLIAGIDAHRSILTHSVIAGVVAEGVLLAAADLASLVHSKLPRNHDPLWDRLAKASIPLTQSLSAGTSAGLAYHLLVDAGIQPAPYHGLPIEMSMEMHQGIMGANGLAESAYVANQTKTSNLSVINQRNILQETTGRKVVNTVTGAAETLGSGIKGFLKGFTSPLPEASEKKQYRDVKKSYDAKNKN